MAFARLLRICMEETDLWLVRVVHMLIVSHGFSLIPALQLLLVRIYGHCAAAEDALQLFRSISYRDLPLWNVIIESLCVNGHMQEACYFYCQMQENGVIPNRKTCMLLLPTLIGHKMLHEGKKSHVLTREIGCESDVAIETALVGMYGRCGALKESKAAFDAMHVRNVVAWTAMISVCLQQNEGIGAFHIFEDMLRERITPDRVAFTKVLAACTACLLLKEGQEVHIWATCYGFEQQISIVNALVQLYGTCKLLKEAEHVFASAGEKDVISFSFLICIYIDAGKIYKTSYLVDNMQLLKLSPNKVFLLTILSKLDCKEALPTGEYIHNCILKKGLDNDIPICNALINMYDKCGYPRNAMWTFDRMPQHNVISWTSLIRIYAQHGQYKTAFSAFEAMQEKGVSPNWVTFVTLLDLCLNEEAHDEGRILHTCIVDSGVESNPSVSTTLIKLYGSSDSFEDAQDVLERIIEPGVESWNHFFSVCSENNFFHGCCKRAMSIFDKMLSQASLPDNCTYGHLLVACAKEGALRMGKQVHARAEGMENEMNVITATNIINMYGRCGSPHFSLIVFDQMTAANVISWTAMISVCIENELGDRALQLFVQMLQEDVLPNMVTMVNIVTLYANLTALAQGKRVHAVIICSEFSSEVALNNALISMYEKCGSLNDAQQTFDDMPEKNVVSWSGMIAAYGHHDSNIMALRLFEEMQLSDVKPNEITFVSVLDACAYAGSLASGECLHTFLMHNRFDLGALVGNSMINMYNKCGDASAAERTFVMMTEKDPMTWSIMMGTFTEHGRGKEAVHLAEQMFEKGLIFDEASITDLLSACSHTGQLDHGCHFFMLFYQGFVVAPNHFSCVVDLFSRAGNLEIAGMLIDSIPLQPTLMSYMALLSACRQQSDMIGGTCLAERILELDQTNSATFHMLNHFSYYEQ
ncbi:hypothetical protein KP509_22G073800 [Ceratopteris richardii]|nr:hypothetical protein KP509_22G073800 [Ceratopteris richardii]